jgi:hypothetical protein
MSHSDFEALRARRNAAANEWAEKMKEQGWDVAHALDPDACYCACGTSGPCEHQWNGEPYESADGSVWSTTCSHCGMTAISHSLRTGP